MRSSLSFLILVFVLTANAGYNLCYKVYNTESKPIEEVLITVFGLTTQTQITDKKGFSEFDVRKGYYHITLSHVGFRDTTLEWRVLDDTCFVIIMEPRNSVLKEVLISSKKPLSKVITYMPNEIMVEAKDIKQFPKIAGETDPIRYLQLLPGISFAQEGSADLNIRGGGKDQTMISVNRMPIFAQEHLLGLYSTFSDKSINNMTLSHGNINAAYGSFGISVVDFDYLTDSIAKPEHSIKVGMLGNTLGSKGVIQKDRWYYNVNARTSYTFFATEIPADFWDFSFGSTYHVDSNNSIEFIAQLSNDNAAFADIANFTLAFNKANNFLQLGWVNHNVPKKRTITNRLGFSQYSKLSYSSTFNNSFEPDSELALNVNGQEWYTYHISIEQYLKKNIKLDYGVQSMLGRNIEREHRYEESIDYSKPFSFAAFQKLVLGEAVNFVPYINLHYNNTNWSYHTALRTNMYRNLTKQKNYLLVEGTAGLTKKSRLNTYSISFDRRAQINHNINPFYIANDLERWSFADEVLNPQIVNQIAISMLYKRKLLSWSNAIYAKNIENVYVYRDGANIYLSDFSGEVLQAAGHAYGIETGLVYNTPVQTISFNYTFSRSFVRNSEVNRGEYFPADFDRPHSLKYFHSLRIRKHTTFSVNALLASGRPLTVIEYTQGPFFIFSDRNEYRLPPYKRIDLSFNHNRTFFNGKFKSEISYGAYNVANFRNPFFVVYSGESIDENGTRITTYDFINLMPIIPYISLEISF